MAEEKSMAEEKENEKGVEPLIIGVVLPFKALKWSNARETIVVQGGSNMSRSKLMQEVANMRNIPAKDQVWSRDGTLVTVSHFTTLPPTLEQIKSRQLIRSLLEIKHKQEVAEAGTVQSKEAMLKAREQVKKAIGRITQLKRGLKRARQRELELKKRLYNCARRRVTSRLAEHGRILLDMV